MRAPERICETGPTIIDANDARTISDTALDRFKQIFRCHAAGVGAVSADTGSGPVLMTITSITSVSVDPPLFVFSISDLSSAAPVLSEAQTFVVHFFSEKQILTDREGCVRTWFRKRTGADEDHQVKRP